MGEMPQRCGVLGPLAHPSHPARIHPSSTTAGGGPRFTVHGSAQLYSPTRGRRGSRDRGEDRASGGILARARVARAACRGGGARRVRPLRPDGVAGLHALRRLLLRGRAPQGARRPLLGEPRLGVHDAPLLQLAPAHLAVVPPRRHSARSEAGTDARRERPPPRRELGAGPPRALPPHRGALAQRSRGGALRRASDPRRVGGVDLRAEGPPVHALRPADPPRLRRVRAAAVVAPLPLGDARVRREPRLEGHARPSASSSSSSGERTPSCAARPAGRSCPWRQASSQFWPS